MMHIDRRYMSAVFREDMLYSAADGSMHAPRWIRAGGKAAKYYPEFHVGGRRIDPSEIDGRRYVLLPRINEGLMLSKVPAWRCFNEEALARSGVDFAKYAGSEPYIYLDMAREQGEQLFLDITFHVADAYIFRDSRPLEEKRAFYAHMNRCFDERAVHPSGHGAGAGRASL